MSDFIDPDTKLPCLPPEKLFTLFRGFWLRRGSYKLMVEQWAAQGTIIASPDFIDPALTRSAIKAEWNKANPGSSPPNDFDGFYGGGPYIDFNTGFEYNMLSIYDFVAERSGQRDFNEVFKRILTEGESYGLTDTYIPLYQLMIRWLCCHWFQVRIASTLRNCFCLDNRGRPDKAD